LKEQKLLQSTLIDEVNVVLVSESGEVLDEQTVTMDTSNIFAYPKESNLFRNVVVGLIILVLVVLVWAIVKKKLNLNIVSILIALSLVSASMIASNPSAVFAQYGDSNDGIIYGCMDMIATNWNPDANTDDGSCFYGTPTMYGCTDPAATNYDPNATSDDGSCIMPKYGCTDFTATNYDPTATMDDGTCNYNMFGCTDPEANNFNPGASIEDWSCRYDGCTDPMATNFDERATDDDGSCIYGGGVVLKNMDLIEIWSVPEDEPSGNQGICEPDVIPAYFYVKIQCEACGNAALDVNINYFNNWKGSDADSPSPYNSSTVVNTSDIGNGHVFYEFVFGPFYYEYHPENFDENGDIIKIMHNQQTGIYTQSYALQVITQFGGAHCKVTKNDGGEIYAGTGIEEEPRDISCYLPAETRSSFFIDYDEDGTQAYDEPYLKAEDTDSSCLGEIGAPDGFIEGYASSSVEMITFSNLIANNCEPNNYAPYFFQKDLHPGMYRAGLDLGNAFGWVQTGIQYLVEGVWTTPESTDTLLGLESNQTLLSKIGLTLEDNGYPVSISCKATPSQTREFPVNVTWSLKHYFSDEYSKEDLTFVWNGIGSLPDNAERSGGLNNGSYTIDYDSTTGGSKDYSIEVYAKNSEGEQVSNKATCTVQIDEMTAQCFAYPNIQAIDAGGVKQFFGVDEDVYWSVDTEDYIGSLTYQWSGAGLGSASGNQNKTVGPVTYSTKKQQQTARVEVTDSEGMMAEASCSIFIRECLADSDCENGMVCDSVEQICVLPPPIFVENLTLDPAVVNTGEQCGLSWTVDYADSCILYKNGQIYDSEAATTTPGVSVDPGTYTISCTNEGGLSVTGGPVRCLVNPNIREQ
jgi:hypothetical protein